MPIDAKTVMDLCKRTGAKLMDCKRALEETGGNEEEAIVILKKKGLAVAEKRATREAKEGRVVAVISADLKTGVLLELNCETSFVAKTDEFSELARDLAKMAVESSGLDTADKMNANEKIKTKIHEIVAKLGEKTEVGQIAVVKVAGAGRLDSYIHAGATLGVLVELKTGTEEAAQSAEAEELGKELAMQIAAASPSYVRHEEVSADVVEKEKEIYRERAKEEKKPEAAWDKIVQGRIGKFFENNCLVDQVYIRDQNVKVSGLISDVAKKLGTSIEVVKFVRYKVGERS